MARRRVIDHIIGGRSREGPASSVHGSDASAIHHTIGGGSRQDPVSLRASVGQVPASEVDSVIADLAAGQHGVVSRQQLLAQGIGRRAIEHRLARKRLHGLYLGVYVVGHPKLATQGRWMAAVLAGGPGAVLSYCASGELWRVVRPSAWRPIEITVSRGLRSRPGLRVHRSSLAADEITEVDGIPTATVARTLLDLASVLDRARLERAVNEAEATRLTDTTGLPALLERYSGRAGTRCLREILGLRELGIDRTRSELEDRFLRFLDEFDLPRPRTNALVVAGPETYEVDCVWRSARLIVELDSREFHYTAPAFERDRMRDRALGVAGWRVIRVTWRQLVLAPQELAADLRRLLVTGPQ